jgi:hypothetical protein
VGLQILLRAEPFLTDGTLEPFHFIVYGHVTLQVGSLDEAVTALFTGERAFTCVQQHVSRETVDLREGLGADFAEKFLHSWVGSCGAKHIRTLEVSL